ncbi:cytochrome C [Aliarcobacter trophiarum LMG 25534]|uniref:Cytochrome C n=1 Tax=Aliarcobacter trophiarum LMG 25534 TaxID=1032241 RepID=A0AAD0QJI6_9BACT|nr:c-type cytochrome [Aliarcobacter trophiarum]AXK49107.1 cytochrome c [Aliarcobacter trophiarum LMG 25534]RXJ90994.1 cytochrome C [Aliarcobacter trophiarum LMG 25534]
MKKIITVALFGALSTGFLLASEVVKFDKKLIGERNNIGYKYNGEKLEYKIPDESTIPNNQFGDLIKYGKELTVHTYKYIGPEVKDKKMRYSGNNLSCQSCHLEAATKPYAAPFVGLYGQFPQYRPRENTIGTLADRINGCMQRSMNGKPLPVESKEMRAFEAYIYWLSQGVPVGAKVEGNSLSEINRKMILTTKADEAKGKEVYSVHCASCHGVNGEGVKNEGLANGYTFPPLWGNDTYNKGAGMYRTLKAADFIKSNMPIGATKENPILTDEEAYNVAVYMNSNNHKRPEKANREKDFPDANVKAPDTYIEGKDPIERQHGPFGQFIKTNK